MTKLTEEDVLYALKRFRRLAKQDLVTSASTSDPEFWRQRAEQRREVYQALADIVRQSGVPMAKRRARQWYRRVVDTYADRSLPPGPQGEKDALESFLRVFGVRPEKLAALRTRRNASRTSRFPVPAIRSIHPGRNG